MDKRRILFPALALLLLAGGTPAVAAEPVAPKLAAMQAGRDMDARAVYERRGRTPLWFADKVSVVRRDVLTKLLEREQRLDPTLAAGPDALMALPRTIAGGNIDADLAWTRAFLAYLDRRQGGEAMLRAPQIDRSLLLLGVSAPASELELAMLDLRMVEAVGGWRTVETYLPPPPIPMSSAEATLVAFVSGDPTGGYGAIEPPAKIRPLPVLSTLRARLGQSGDIRAGDVSLDQAVQRFQHRHGLAVDGVVGPATLAALNTPVARQIRQIELNLTRRRQIEDRRRLDRYVEVDVAGFELRLIEGGKVTLRSRVIVGDEETPTPIFDDRIRYVELNPFWYVPDSITPELLERERAKPGYLNEHGYAWRDGGTRLVQKPGPENALGNYKFLFPNRHAVYLHDTAQRGLFSRSARSLSHGCVRVEKATELAHALLGPLGWTPERIGMTIAEGKTRRIELPRTVPVFLDYRTAYIDDDGELQLRGDLYGHDTAGIESFRSKGLPVAPPRVAPTVPQVRPPIVAPLVPAMPVTPPGLAAPSLPEASADEASALPLPVGAGATMPTVVN